ncbi:MAG: hypothetical protein ACRD0Z_15940 [Acidimicrobiales bacterium]
MPGDLAELSSIASMLDELSRRVSVMAETASQEKQERAAAELFAVEKALQGATRRLERLLGS